MGSFDRSKKGIHLWKKALLHFSLCFVMGLFTGFAPANTAAIFSGRGTLVWQNNGLGDSLAPIQAVQNVTHVGNLNTNRSLMGESPASSSESGQTFTSIEEYKFELIPRKLLIMVTRATFNSPLQGALLRRMSNTFNLVPSPLLWIVVEPRSDSSELPEILRKTGVMYRHLVYKENFTDPEAEADYQRTLALNHIEHHRLDGIVHFAELSYFYDLQFFEELRDIETFGAWPMAKLSANRQRVVIEGPICTSSSVIGWHMENRNSQTAEVSLHLSNFAFNSSILWDPERWGRTSSAQDTSQDSLNFIQQVALEDESKLKCIPSNSPKIMSWHLNLQTLKRPSTISGNEPNRA